MTIQQQITSELQHTIKPSAAKWLSKEQVKSAIATQYIGDGALDSSTDRYRKLYNEYNLANTGNYSAKDIIWVSSNGRRWNRVIPVVHGKLAGVYKNILLAMEVGATIVMDTLEHLSSTSGYNTGELALAEYLASHNYTRQGTSGIWVPIKQTNKP